MVRRLGLLAGLCFGALGCGEEPAAEITVAVPVETWAWIGGDEDLELVLEPFLARETQQLAQYQWTCFITLFTVVLLSACLYEAVS